MYNKFQTPQGFRVVRNLRIFFFLNRGYIRQDPEAISCGRYWTETFNFPLMNSAEQKSGRNNLQSDRLGNFPLKHT